MWRLPRRALWMQAWSGDHEAFRSKLAAAACGAERKRLFALANPHGWNALHFAVVYGRDEMIDAILAEHPELASKPTSKGWLPLHYASGFGHTHLIDRLLATGGELHCRNEAPGEHLGWTPLHRAFKWWLDPNKRNAIEHLLSLGADPTALDAAGRTPVDLTSDACLSKTNRLLAEAAAAGRPDAELARQSAATQKRFEAAPAPT